MRDRLLPSARVSDPRSAVVRPARSRSERISALTLLLADTSAPNDLAEHVGEVVALEERGDLSLAGLLIAVGPCETSDVLAATMMTPGPGGAADLFAPRFFGRPSDGLAAALFSAAGKAALAAGCDRLQAFADPVRSDDAALFAAAGFDRVAELRMLRRECVTPLDSRRESPVPTLTLTSETRRLFRETIRETYVESRDAPDARGADADADFESHLASAGFRPDLCRLATEKGAPTGVALISASGEGDSVEWDVCYLGVVPGSRGKGVGRRLLADRLTAARDAGAAAVTCVVDAANAPARRLYAASGFVETASRVLFLKRMDGPAPASDGGHGSVG